MEPIFIISVIYTFNCFTNGSMKSICDKPEIVFGSLSWIKKIKVTLASDGKIKKASYLLRIIFCLWLHPKTRDMLYLSALSGLWLIPIGNYFKANSNNIWCQKWKEINTPFFYFSKVSACNPYLPPDAFLFSKASIHLCYDTIIVITLWHFSFKKPIAHSPLHFFLKDWFS